MLKTALGSDIHLEFGQYDIRNKENADVLILSGDITLAKKWHDNYKLELHRQHQVSHVFRKFFEQAVKEFPIILYVMGNHEHYHGDFQQSYPWLKECLGPFPNVHLLEKETYHFSKDWLFFGATLWTNMNNRDFATMKEVGYGMNDFQIVANGSSGKFTPLAATNVFDETTEKLKEVYNNLPKNQNMVVLTHHAPSSKSVHPRYQNPQDHHMNFGYYSSLEDFIWDRPKIKLWTHGHVHTDFDYVLGSQTRVVCNPRGYIGHEVRAMNFDLKYIELEN